MFISLEISFKIRINFSFVFDQEKKKGVKYLMRRASKESSRYVSNVKNVFLEKKRLANRMESLNILFVESLIYDIS